MPFFEEKQALYQILCLIIMPISICAIFFFFRPKKIWVSPIVIMFVFLILTIIFYPYIFTDILTRNYDFTTVNWFIYFVPIQIFSTMLTTFTTHYLYKRKSRINRT